MTTPHPDRIYHLADAEAWAVAREVGAYTAPSLALEGFIHFSTATQLEQTARVHRRGVCGLVLLEVNATALGETLRWEESRGGALFPHVYGTLPIVAVVRAWPLVGAADAADYDALIG